MADVLYFTDIHYYYRPIQWWIQGRCPGDPPPPPPHLFLDQTGAWRAKKKMDMKSGGKKEETHPTLPPRTPPRCFFVLISLHAVPTIWAPGIGLILSSAHRWTSIILAGKRNSTEIKIHVYAKRQTWICTTRPMFPLIFRLLFIAPTQK